MTSRKPKTGWTFYRTRVRKEWRWRFRARNGKTTKASTEGYKRKIDCLKNARASGCTG